MGSRQAVFLDRDGVINENRSDYVKSWEEFVFLPGVMDAFCRLADSHFVIVVITNQSAVGRGLLALDRLEAIHQQMIAELTRNGGRVDAVYFCPHHPDDRCTCRKPQPGLLLRAAQDLEIDLSKSYVIGDAQSDIQVALNAGCAPVLVLSGRGSVQRDAMPVELLTRCRVVDDLSVAVDFVVCETKS